MCGGGYAYHTNVHSVPLTLSRVQNKNDLDNLVKMAEANFNDVYDETMEKWGDAEASGRQMAATLKRQTRA